MEKNPFPAYHPISLDTEALAGKALESYSTVHASVWRELSPNRKKEIRGEFREIATILRESLATGCEAFLVDYGTRAGARLSARSFPEGFAAHSLRAFASVVAEEIPPEYQKTAGTFIQKSLLALKARPDTATRTSESQDIPMTPAAREFLVALRNGKSRDAEEIIERERAAGLSATEIYQTIFQPVLVETGRLWQVNEIGIEDEHSISASVVRIMGRMEEQYLEAHAQTMKRGRIVAACVGEELHEIGIRMVADFFLMDGWSVRYLGANIPASSILNAVRMEQAPILVLSVTLPSRLPELHYLIRSLRADPALAKTRVIVGGYPFLLVPDLWKRIGADAGAAGAGEAVEAARRFIAEGRKTPRTR